MQPRGIHTIAEGDEVGEMQGADEREVARLSREKKLLFVLGFSRVCQSAVPTPA